MVDIDNQICFGAITKGDFSSPLQEIFTPSPVGKEGHATTGDTPAHKTPAQWRVFEGTKDFFSRRGKRPQVDREHREFWEPDARLVARQVELQLKTKELEVKEVELRIQEQRERNTLVEIELKAAELRLVQAKHEQQGEVASRLREKEAELAVQQQRALAASASRDEQAARLAISQLGSDAKAGFDEATSRVLAAALQLQSSLARAGKPVEMPVIHEVFLRAGIEQGTGSGSDSDSEFDLDAAIPTYLDVRSGLFEEFEAEFGHSVGSNGSSGWAAVETIAGMRHAALVRRHEERHRKAAADFDKARRRGGTDGDA